MGGETGGVVKRKSLCEYRNVIMQSNENPEVVRAYALLGQCGTLYAELEYRLQFLLATLHIGQEHSIETVLFTRGATFQKKILLIEELAQLRLQEFPDLLKTVLDLMIDLEKARINRNLFIHGFWIVNKGVINEGILRVSDTSWDYDRKEASYKTMDSKDIPLGELEMLPKKLDDLINRCRTVIAELLRGEWKLTVSGIVYFRRP